MPFKHSHTEITLIKSSDYLHEGCQCFENDLTHTFGNKIPGLGHFMHASTATGREGDSAWLETAKMTPSGKCQVQCLQFYYYHSGNQTGQLNIWLREFRDWNTGTDRLVKQITGHLKIFRCAFSAL